MTLRISDWIRAIRPFNCLMAAAAVFVGASIAFGNIAFQWPVLLAMASAFLVCGAGLSINDFFDFETDLKKGKQKFQQISKETKHELLGLALVLFVLGIAVAFFVNQYTTWIAVGISLLLILYSWILPKQKWVGNAVVALGTALPLVFGASVFAEFDAVFFLATSAFFVNWAREIVKDVQDLDADEGKKTTLPMILNLKAVDAIVGALVVLGILFSYLPVFLGIFGKSAFLIVVTVANALFVQAFWQFRNFKTAASQRTFKTAMFVALVGFLLGI